MKVSSVIWTAVVVLAGAGACKAYSALQPDIKNASEAQIRAWSPKELLVSPKENPAQRERFERFLALAEQVESVEKADTSKTAGLVLQQERDDANYLVNRDVLGKIDQLLKEGPLQEGSSQKRAASFMVMRTLADALSASVEVTGRRGDKTACESLVAEFWNLTNGSGQRSSSPFGYFSLNNERASIAATVDAARSGWITPAAIKKTLDHIPSATIPDPSLLIALRNDYQGLIPLLSRENRISPEVMGEQTTASYDSQETTRFLSSIYEAAYRNAFRDWTHQQPFQSYELNRKLAGLPRLIQPMASNDYRGGVDPLMRLRFSTYPNAIGISLCESKVQELPSLAQSFMAMATRREILRAVLACKLYQADHLGKAPASLKDLVTQRYLSKVPWDPFGAKPLRYRASIGWIESVGPQKAYEQDVPPDAESLQKAFGNFINRPVPSNITPTDFEAGIQDALLGRSLP